MKQVLILTAALLALAGTGLNCRKDGDYTILVDREDTLYLLPGGYAGGSHGSLEAGDELKAEFSVLDGGGQIDFLVLSDADLALWESNQQYEAVIEVANSNGGTKTGAVIKPGKHWFIASNKDDSAAGRKVFYEVWRKDR